MKAVLFAAGLVCGALSPAYARFANYSTDQFVRMIEQSMSEALHKAIAPGVMITTMSGTYEYRGVRIDGHHYHVDIDKLD